MGAPYSLVPLTINHEEDSVDKDDLDLDAIYFYQAAYLKAYIDPDYCDALKDSDRDLLHDFAAPAAQSSTPVADVPIPDNLSGIIAAQKTAHFCQNFFATMCNAK